MSAERKQLGSYGLEIARNRELRAERVNLVEIMRKQGFGIAAECKAQAFGGYERVAVAVAANPAAKPDEALGLRPELAFPAGVKRRKRVKKHVAEIG